MRFLHCLATLLLGFATLNVQAQTAQFEDMGPQTTLHWFQGEDFSITYDTSAWASATLNSATLWLYASDDFDPLWSEVAFVHGDGFAFLNEVDTGTAFLVGSVERLVNWGGAGTLDGRVSSVWGDFRYSGMALRFDFTPFSPVPEASTVLMLGAGLLAVGLVARRRRDVRQG